MTLADVTVKRIYFLGGSEMERERGRGQDKDQEKRLIFIFNNAFKI